MERYFIKFPNTVYQNVSCKDITARVVPQLDMKKNPVLFYKYDLKNAVRADRVAAGYYDDSYYDWLIYLTNGIIDPYYDWYLNDVEFNQLIIKKYGSVENAMDRVRHYQLNWQADDNEITPDHYNNSLPGDLRKYYDPVYGQGSKIISYKRRQDDFIVNTNKIIEFTIANTTGNGFVVADLVNILPNDSNTFIGQAEVLFANSTIVKVKNVSGNTSANNRLSSNSTVSTIVDSDVLTENLTDEESVFWSPVFYYEYEIEKNEANKGIRLLDQRYAMETAEKLRVTLKVKKK